VVQVTLQVKEPLKNSSDNNLDSDHLFLAGRWPWWFLHSFQANPVHPPPSCQDNLKLRRFNVATPPPPGLTTSLPGGPTSNQT
ncbi:hypothetical protein ATANTOWER_002121, partial [Ataeniobius toweri]|nr:hypothetical protein [Ataeniobius toweri]